LSFFFSLTNAAVLSLHLQHRSSEALTHFKFARENQMPTPNLSSLVHELRERIAATSSTPPNTNTNTAAENDSALEIRFRAVLPNLLHAYVVPSSSGNHKNEDKT
jgi:hypothetical protein